MIRMLLLAGTYLSTARETINYGAKENRPAGSFEKVEIFVLDVSGRPHTIGAPRDFDHNTLPARGGAVVLGVRCGVFRGEVQLSVEKVLTSEEVRHALGSPPVSGVRSAEQKSA